jgi:hypothetical protein
MVNVHIPLLREQRLLVQLQAQLPRPLQRCSQRSLRTLRAYPWCTCMRLRVLKTGTQPVAASVTLDARAAQGDAGRLAGRRWVGRDMRCQIPPLRHCSTGWSCTASCAACWPCKLPEAVLAECMHMHLRAGMAHPSPDMPMQSRCCQMHQPELQHCRAIVGNDHPAIVRAAAAADNATACEQCAMYAHRCPSQVREATASLAYTRTLPTF